MRRLARRSAAICMLQGQVLADSVFDQLFRGTARSHQTAQLLCAAANGAKFDATSGYAQDYPAHEVQPRAYSPPPHPAKDNTPFDATSSYRVGLIAHTATAAQPAGGMSAHISRMYCSLSARCKACHSQ